MSALHRHKRLILHQEQRGVIVASHHLDWKLDRDFFENGLFPRIVVFTELSVQLRPREEALAVRAEQDRMV